MKSDKSLWGSISILIGVVIGILALVKGSLQVWLLLGVFTLWGLWIVAFLLMPYMRRQNAAKSASSRNNSVSLKALRRLSAYQR